jgi:hypothetical protein
MGFQDREQWRGNVHDGLPTAEQVNDLRLIDGRWKVGRWSR